MLILQCAPIDTLIELAIIRNEERVITKKIDKSANTKKSIQMVIKYQDYNEMIDQIVNYKLNCDDRAWGY